MFNSDIYKKNPIFSVTDFLSIQVLILMKTKRALKSKILKYSKNNQIMQIQL